MFLYCDSVSDCFYEEESEISDCIMKQAGTFGSLGLFFVKILYLFITVNYDGLLATGRVLFYTLHNGSYVRNMALLMVGYVVQS